MQIGVTQLWNILKSVGLNFKKSAPLSEQDSERVAADRNRWREESEQIRLQNLIFLDESGVTTENDQAVRASYGRRMR